MDYLTLYIKSLAEINLLVSRRRGIKRAIARSKKLGKLAGVL